MARNADETLEILRTYANPWREFAAREVREKSIPPHVEAIVLAVENLNDGEREQFFRLLAFRHDLLGERRVMDISYLMTMQDGFMRVREAYRDGEASRKILKVELDRRTPKPRTQTRNEVIVRLRDDDKLTWKEIGKRLLSINPEWVGKDGKAMKEDALARAYTRHKARLSKSA